MVDQRIISNKDLSLLLPGGFATKQPTFSIIDSVDCHVVRQASRLAMTEVSTLSFINTFREERSIYANSKD